MNETKTKAKKPPAHEVIIARLQEIANELAVLRHQPSMCGTGPTAEEELRQLFCGELLNILAAMHLPEQTRPAIFDALRALDSDVIGVHRSHARLLHDLSGDHDPLVETNESPREGGAT